MYKTITPETARKVFYDNYNYEQISGNKLRATDIDGADELRLIFPTSAPLDENGRPFAPGGENAELTHFHPIFQELQLDPFYVADVTISTGIFRQNENGDPEFEFTTPDEAADIMLFIDWDGVKPPVMRDLDCEFARRFCANYFRRVEPEKGETEAGLNTFGIDFWIIPKHAIFTDDCKKITYDIRRRIAAGDVFIATKDLVKPAYRKYMEDTLYPCLQAIHGDYDAEFGEDYVDVFHVVRYMDDAGKLLLGEGSKTQLGRYPYTLEGAQKLSLLASTRGVTQTTPIAAPSAQKSLIPDPTPATTNSSAD